MTTHKSTADMDMVERVLQDVLGPVQEAQIPESGPIEVQVHGGQWVAVTSDIWRSWTGPRRIWGIEHHGPVYALGAPDDALPYDGARVCRCSTCQQHVRPSMRPN